MDSYTRSFRPIQKEEVKERRSYHGPYIIYELFTNDLPTHLCTTDIRS